ncbi:hypothetical protein V9T40_011238 [Parthenolecanium corni]|uniref:Uncharacterized protein n=1 Tax=Parthenolecanium corni TaxID=536013 RepID=A0AAN9XY81_9HEMI
MENGVMEVIEDPNDPANFSVRDLVNAVRNYDVPIPEELESEEEQFPSDDEGIEEEAGVISWRKKGNNWDAVSVNRGSLIPKDDPKVTKSRIYSGGLQNFNIRQEVIEDPNDPANYSVRDLVNAERNYDVPVPEELEVEDNQLSSEDEGIESDLEVIKNIMENLPEDPFQ